MVKQSSGKYIGVVRVGDKGQIVIPKDARDLFDIKPGDQLVLLCDIKQGMAIVKNDEFINMANTILAAQKEITETEKEGDNNV